MTETEQAAADQAAAAEKAADEKAEADKQAAAASAKRKKVKARVVFAGVDRRSSAKSTLVDKSDLPHPDLDADPGAVAYAESLKA